MANRNSYNADDCRNSSQNSSQNKSQNNSQNRSQNSSKDNYRDSYRDSSKNSRNSSNDCDNSSRNNYSQRKSCFPPQMVCSLQRCEADIPPGSRADAGNVLQRFEKMRKIPKAEGKYC